MFTREKLYKIDTKIKRKIINSVSPLSLLSGKVSVIYKTEVDFPQITIYNVYTI